MQKYRVVVYFDVEFHEDIEIWSVGHTKTSDKVVSVEEGEPAGEVLQQIKSFGYIDSYDRRKIKITDLNRDIVEISRKKTREPLCRLERIHV